MIEILRTPEIKKYKYKKFETEDEILQEMIEYFIGVLEKNVLKENLQLFYNNISSLKIENKSVLFEIIFGIFKNSTVTGYYFLDENIISVLPLKDRKFWNRFIGILTEEYIINLYHELLHMSSTIIDKDKKIAFSGFAQVKDDSSIGLAIDDGYTEVLLYRYFDFNKEFMSYDYEIVITSLIEEIIGTEKMTNFYFNASLYDLINEIMKYNTKENVVKFLDDFDSIYVLQEHSRKYKKDIIYYHNEISQFLVNTYLNKLKSDLEGDRITDVLYNIKLDKYLNNIHVAFEKLEVDKRVRKK